MHIYGPSHVHASSGINAPHSSPVNRPVQGSAPAITDHLEISAAAEAAMRTSESSEIRSGLVAQIRAQIADGTYETPEKLDAALSRMLDQIG